METGLRRLRYFRALAEGLNFRATAERLNITQPALSRAIAQLEADVGVALFERTNRQVRLTLAGETFAAGCDRVLKSLDGAIDQTLRVAHGFAGNLTIGYTDTVIAGVLPDIIQSFRGRAPGIHIQLMQVHTQQQVAMLEGGLLDVGLFTGPVEREGLRTVDIQADAFVAIVPGGHALTDRSSIALRDLADSSFVLGDMDRWGAYHAHLFPHFERAGVRPCIVQTAPEARAIIGLVTCGLGVSVMPESLVQNLDRRVVALPLHDIADPLVTQAGWFTNFDQPALRRFVEHLSSFKLAQRTWVSLTNVVSCL